MPKTRKDDSPHKVGAHNHKQEGNAFSTEQLDFDSTIGVEDDEPQKSHLETLKSQYKADGLHPGKPLNP